MADLNELKAYERKLFAFVKRVAEADTPAHKLAEELDDVIRLIFPQSYVNVRFNTSLGSSISIKFALGKDKSEYSNGIIHNDMLYHIIWIGHSRGTEITKEGVLNEPLSLDISLGGAIRVNEKRVKLGWRNKKKATRAQVVEHVKKYFKKVKEVSSDHKEHFPDMVRDKL